jgi:hypothetical protein
MIYNLDNTINIGRPIKDAIDANGIHWDNCLEIDTETGRIVKHKVMDGFLIVDPVTDDIVIEELATAAPITIIFEGPSRHEPYKGFKYEGCTCKGQYVHSSCMAHQVAANRDNNER